MWVNPGVDRAGADAATPCGRLPRLVCPRAASSAPPRLPGAYGQRNLHRRPKTLPVSGRGPGRVARGQFAPWVSFRRGCVGRRGSACTCGPNHRDRRRSGRRGRNRRWGCPRRGFPRASRRRRRATCTGARRYGAAGSARLEAPVPRRRRPRRQPSGRRGAGRRPRSPPRVAGSRPRRRPCPRTPQHPGGRMPCPGTCPWSRTRTRTCS